MKKVILIFSLGLTLASCGILRVSSGTKFKNSDITKVEFCDLSGYNGKLIKTKLEYSGMEEYWSAYGFEDCKLNHKVYLNFQEYDEGLRWFFLARQRNKLSNNYPTHKAKMTVIGVFQQDATKGFGHLNTMPAEILVKSVRMIVKKKNTLANNSYK